MIIVLSDYTCDPPERDSLIPVNPGFIRCMYFQWSLDFMTYDLPMAVDLLSRYDASCSPFNPQQLSPKPPLPTLPPEISQRVQLALRLAGRLRGTPLDSQLAYDFFCEAYAVADHDLGIQEAIASGNNFQLPMGEMIRDVAAVAERVWWKSGGTSC